MVLSHSSFFSDDFKFKCVQFLKNVNIYIPYADTGNTSHQQTVQATMCWIRQIYLCSECVHWPTFCVWAFISRPY